MHKVHSDNFCNSDNRIVRYDFVRRPIVRGFRARIQGSNDGQTQSCSIYASPRQRLHGLVEIDSREL